MKISIFEKTEVLIRKKPGHLLDMDVEEDLVFPWYMHQDIYGLSTKLVSDSCLINWQRYTEYFKGEKWLWDKIRKNYDVFEAWENGKLVKLSVPFKTYTMSYPGYMGNINETPCYILPEYNQSNDVDDFSIQYKDHIGMNLKKLLSMEPEFADTLYRRYRKWMTIDLKHRIYPKTTAYVDLGITIADIMDVFDDEF